MTWTRVVQTGFESGKKWELNSGYSATISDSFVDTTREQTGSYGCSGNSLVGSHFLDVGVQRLRTACLVWPNTMSYITGTSGGARLLEFYCPYAGNGLLTFGVESRDNMCFLFRYYNPATETYVDLANIPNIRYGLGHYECRTAIGATISVDPYNPYFSFYVNGRKVYTYTGAALLLADSILGVGYLRKVIFEGNSGWEAFDDIYIESGDEEEDDGVPPTYRLGVKPTTNDGSSINWIPVNGGDNYVEVDDVPLSETDYVYTLDAGSRDLYAGQYHTPPDFHNVISTIPTARIKKGDAQKASTAKFIIRNTNSGFVSVGVAQDLSSAYEYRHERFPLSPDGLPWSLSLINVCEYGFESDGAL